MDVGSGLGVEVGSGVLVGVGCGVNVGSGVGVGVGSGVLVGVGCGVDVGSEVGVGVGSGVLVSVGRGVNVGVETGIGVRIVVSGVRSVGARSRVGVEVGGITTGVGTRTSPCLASGSLRKDCFSSSSRKTGLVGFSFVLEMLFCSSVITCLPNSFSSAHDPRKQLTFVSPVFLSYSTLIQVPRGEAVPAGVTISKGRSSD